MPVAEIKKATTRSDFDEAARLMRGFLTFQQARYLDMAPFLDKYFDADAWENELSELNTKYAPPDGAVLLATVDGQARGVVAMHRLEDSVCEMKRLFVEPAAHGLGLGRELCVDLISRAREAGYRKMRLDTGIRQNEAQGLYRSLGFSFIEPYHDYPKDMLEGLVFMELIL